MNADPAISMHFPDVSVFSRGDTRPVNAFKDLKALEQTAIRSTVDFLHILKWRVFSRIASMAGPLATKYTVKHDKPQLIKSEAQRIARAQQGGAVPPPSSSAGGTVGTAAKAGGFAAAGKSIAARATQSLAPVNGGSKRRSAAEEDEDGDYSDWMPSARGGGISGSWVDFMRTPHGKLVLGLI